MWSRWTLRRKRLKVLSDLCHERDSTLLQKFYGVIHSQQYENGTTISTNNEVEEHINDDNDSTGSPTTGIETREWYSEQNQLPTEEVIEETILNQESSLVTESLTTKKAISKIDIAIALIILKSRHKLSQKAIDDFCLMLHVLKVQLCPRSYRAAKRLVERRSIANLLVKQKSLCPQCGKSSSSITNCDDGTCSLNEGYIEKPLTYLQFPIEQQIREILLTEKKITFPSLHLTPHDDDKQNFTCSSDSGIETRSNGTTPLDFIKDITDGRCYRQILREETGPFISLIMNGDGVQVSNSSNNSLWIFTLIINEINRSFRFKMKNVIVAAIWSGKRKPNKQQIAEVIKSITVQLQALECTNEYTLHNGDSIQLKTFLLGVSCDKPAQSLIQNLTEYNGAFGCGKCHLQGELVLSGANEYHTIRVFPLPSPPELQPELRTNVTYDAIMQIIEEQEQCLDKKTSEEKAQDAVARHGHLGLFALRNLKYMDFG
ncbi:unnamed protein product, partial [Didymodactylos carnosus]